MSLFDTEKELKKIGMSFTSTEDRETKIEKFISSAVPLCEGMSIDEITEGLNLLQGLIKNNTTIKLQVVRS